MQVVLAILSVGLLGLIIYYVFSPKSSRFLKLAALIALGLIGLSLGVSSVFLILNGFEQSQEEARLPVFLGIPEEPPEKGNVVEILIFAAILLFILGLITVVAIKDNRKRKEEAKKAEGARIFQHSDEAPDLDAKVEEPDKKPEKTGDDFDLRLD